MKHHVFKLCLFLLVGAILNVAVAWVSAAVVDPNDVTMRLLIEKTGFTVVQSRFGHVRRNSMLESFPNDRLYRAESRCGWPTLALRCHTYDGVMLLVGVGVYLGPVNAMRDRSVNGGIALPPWSSYPFSSRTVAMLTSNAAQITPPGTWRALPCIPIWPGFAINTIFYAAILWVLFAFPFVIRRRRRIKRGLCPKCAYDLRGSASQTCPECGGPAP